MSHIAAALARTDIQPLQSADLWSAHGPVLSEGTCGTFSALRISSRCALQPTRSIGPYLVQLTFEEGESRRLVTRHSVFWQQIDAASPQGARF